MPADFGSEPGSGSDSFASAGALPEARPTQPWILDDGDPPVATLERQGFALLGPGPFGRLAGVPPTVLDAWAGYWDRLGPDGYLRDGGRYRHRRHGSFVQDLGPDPGPGRDPADACPADPAPADPALTAPALRPVAHRPHWQSTDYNALHGGIERWFDPLEPSWVADPLWRRLLSGLGTAFAACAANQGRPVARWFVEAHAFRIDAADGVGRPTPEGAHRDGVDFVAVILVSRRSIKGGETRVFQAEGPLGIRFVIEAPWSALLLDDARVIHETTPIQPLAQPAWRDTLVLTYRRDGFQAAGAADQRPIAGS